MRRGDVSGHRQRRDLSGNRLGILGLVLGGVSFALLSALRRT